MQSIYGRFRDYVMYGKLILPGDRVLMSLSAGKDSMFMLDLIMKLKDESGFETGIFHLNHLTRGNDSDQDEQLIIEKAAHYGIPCHIERFDFKNNRVKGISFEEQARDTRYMLLKRISGREKYSKIATAHNRNDNAETVLMRVLSGTGIAGIKGIPPVSGNIIRPVLFADKKEIYGYLETNRIVWREDLSNIEDNYLRNYTRNRIFPVLNERFPDAEYNLSNLAKHAAENQELLQSLADMLYLHALIAGDSGITIFTDDFHDNIPLIKFYISRAMSDYYGFKMKISVYQEIIRRYLVQSTNMVLYENEKISVRKGLMNDKKAIFITDRVKMHVANTPWEYELTPDNSMVSIPEIKKNIRLIYTDFEYYINNRDFSGCIFIQPEDSINRLTIRNRRDGDRIKLESGTKKIKKLMIEKKLDSNAKKNIPLILADGQTAAYLPGIVNQGNNRIACNFLVGNNTKRILAFFFTDY
jgi:tRNA(Ile)-lysidine synthase